MHDISNITTIYHRTGIFFNTRELEEDTIVSPYCLFHSLGIFFNTREYGGDKCAPFYDVVDHCTGIIFNTRVSGWQTRSTMLSNTTAFFHSMGIIFNTRELEEDTIISLYCLFRSVGIIFNTRE